MWELWEWDGRYIKGKKLKRSKTKQTVMKHAEKHMEYDRIVKGSKKGEFFNRSVSFKRELH